MIVDAFAERATGEARVQRSARVRWAGGEQELRIELPAAAAAPAQDATPWLAATLLIAMRRGEDLEVDGPVSPRLLAAVDDIQEIYTGWGRHLRRAVVRTAGVTATDGERADGVASLFSRGVDSSYTVAAPHDPPLSLLVFIEGLDPRLSAGVRAQEAAMVRAAAADRGLPVEIVSWNLRDLTDPVLNWADVLAGGLAAVGHALAGAINRLVIPSDDAHWTLGCNGSHPLLDPLYSSERVTIEHGRLLDRTSKIAWLAEHRPELIPHLHVCFAEDRPDNCGRCGKCLLTMVGLHLVGALEAAEGFPDRIDADAIRAIRRVPAAQVRPKLEWANAARQLPEEDAELRAAILAMLRDRGGFVDPRRDGVGVRHTFRTEEVRTHLSMMRDGLPYPPVPGDQADGPGARADAEAGWTSAVALVRAVEPLGRRHVYGIGGLPAGRDVAELGALRRSEPPEGGVPVRLTSAGLVATEDPPLPLPPGRRAALRWALAPLTRRGGAATAAWRLRSLAAPEPPPAEPPAGEPLGWLHRDDGPRRVPLHAGLHPVTGDQLLSNDPSEPRRLGYTGTVLLGFLDAEAPLTGELGRAASPGLPWGDPR